MVALGFIYVVFMSHLSYILLEKREDFYKEKMFWYLIIGLMACLYLTAMIFKLF